MRRTIGIPAAVAGLAAALAAGCISQLTPEEEMPLTEQAYRRMRGSSGAILENTKFVLECLGGEITGERAVDFAASVQLDQRPVILYVRAEGDKLYLRFNNLKPTKLEERWRLRLYREIEAALQNIETDLTRTAGKRRR